jgi:RNA polymerase sigma-70 factor (ECF subfamily)
MVTEGAAATIAEDDLSLARRCVAGDRAAQRQVFREHKQRVHRVLYRILGSNRELEDLTQDAFLEIFRSLESFRGEAKLATWVSRITTRVAFAYIGRRKPAAASLDVLPPIDAGGPAVDEQAMMRQAGARLYAALDKLDPKQRVAFALHAIEGLSLKEVAVLTESSLVAVKTRVWRCRRDLEKRAKRDPLLAAFLVSDSEKEAS